MIKKFLGGVAVLIVAIVTAVNVNINTKKESPFSMLALANIEALASETTGSARCIGFLGWCELDCEKCRAKLYAPGSGYEHNCIN